MSMILVTGGAGYIGSHTVLELLAAGFDVAVVDNLCNANAKVIDVLRELSGRDIAFYQADVRDAAALQSIFRQHRFDAVVHFAGLKAVGESVAQPLRYYDNNVGGTLTLCQAMSEAEVFTLVFSSSATVYGFPERMPIVETDPVDSAAVANPYARTKVVIEGLLQDVQVADPRWRVALLRYFNPIGAHASGRIGEDPRGIPNNLMPFITQVAVGRRPHLSVFGDDYETADGTGVRDYVHVVDLAKGHLAALDYLERHPGVEAFNLGNGKGYSVLEMVRTFEEATGLMIPYQVTERRPGDIATSYCDPAKAQNLLNWRAELDLLQMCADSWRWQKQNPQGFGEA